jgi:hypothetical protein
MLTWGGLDLPFGFFGMKVQYGNIIYKNDPEACLNTGYLDSVGKDLPISLD